MTLRKSHLEFEKKSTSEKPVMEPFNPYLTFALSAPPLRNSGSTKLVQIMLFSSFNCCLI